jgi:predicted signal transduction protein with EAL and GGDEF domain
MGRRLIDGLSRTPYLLDEEAVLIGASTGIAMLPGHGEDFTALLLAADRALYEAKSQGGSRCAIAGRGSHGEQPIEAEEGEPMLATARAA